jgi:hypothetical protein
MEEKLDEFTAGGMALRGHAAFWKPSDIPQVAENGCYG